MCDEKPNVAIREHFKRRYCERILEISNDKEILQYIVQNNDKLTEDILTLFQYSKLLWKGAINDNITRNFYIKDQIIIVTDTNNNSLFTIYKIDFGFPEKTNVTITKDLLSEIEKLNEKMQDACESNQSIIDNKCLEIENTSREIACLEEKINVLKQRKTSLEEEVKYLGVERFLYQKEIDKHSVKLCNSLGYKLDSLPNKKKNESA